VLLQVLLFLEPLLSLDLFLHILHVFVLLLVIFLELEEVASLQVLLVDRLFYLGKVPLQA
jgi:hypothetical protein